MSAHVIPTPLLHGAHIGYAWHMASDRMMQAIGALERAIGRLEQAAAALPAPAPATQAATEVDASGARAALKSLDDLINELKARTDG